MNKKHVPYLVGGGLFLLLVKSKPKPTALQVQAAETISISRQGRTIAKHLSRLGGEERSQLRAIHNVITAPSVQGIQFIRGGGGWHLPYIGAMPRIIGWSKCSPRTPVYAAEDEVGAPPYELTANPPSPMEVAILYSIDPNFVIKGPGILEQTVSQLLVHAIEVQPAIKKFAQEKNPAQLIENAISIFSLPQLRAFSLDVATDMVLSVSGQVGDAVTYQEFLSDLRSMMAYKAANGEIVNFRDPAAIQLKTEVLASLAKLDVDLAHITDQGSAVPPVKKRSLLSAKKDALAKEMDQMMVSLYDLVWASNPFATMSSNQEATIKVLKDSQTIARTMLMKKSNILARAVKWKGFVSAEYLAASRLADKQVYRSTAEVISDRIFKGRQPMDQLNDPIRAPELTPLSRGEEQQGRKIWDDVKRVIKELE